MIPIFPLNDFSFAYPNLCLGHKFSLAHAAFIGEPNSSLPLKNPIAIA
jgi:hypothetical protein